jgi:hypothetical protein
MAESTITSSHDAELRTSQWLNVSVHYCGQVDGNLDTGGVVSTSGGAVKLVEERVKGETKALAYRQ